MLIQWIFMTHDYSMYVLTYIGHFGCGLCPRTSPVGFLYLYTGESDSLKGVSDFPIHGEITVQFSS